MADPTLRGASGDGGRPRVQSVARATAILVAVAESDSGLTTKQISETVGITRQAAYHLLHTLIETGMLARTDGNRVILGLRVATLAGGFESQKSPAERLSPLVRELSQATEETSYAAGWHLGEIIAHAVARGTNAIQAAETPKGYTGMAHTRASGKVLLAAATDDVRENYLDAHELTAATANTITDRAALLEELRRVRAAGYAVDREEFAEGVCCVSVPLDSGPTPFVIAVSAPRERFEQNFERNLSIMYSFARGERPS